MPNDNILPSLWCEIPWIAPSCLAPLVGTDKPQLLRKSSQGFYSSLLLKEGDEPGIAFPRASMEGGWRWSKRIPYSLLEDGPCPTPFTVDPVHGAILVVDTNDEELPVIRVLDANGSSSLGYIPSSTMNHALVCHKIFEVLGTVSAWLNAASSNCKHPEKAATWRAVSLGVDPVRGLLWVVTELHDPFLSACPQLSPTAVTITSLLRIPVASPKDRTLVYQIIKIKNDAMNRRYAEVGVHLGTGNVYFCDSSESCMHTFPHDAPSFNVGAPVTVSTMLPFSKDCTVCPSSLIVNSTDDSIILALSRHNPDNSPNDLSDMDCYVFGCKIAGAQQHASGGGSGNAIKDGSSFGDWAVLQKRERVSSCAVSSLTLLLLLPSWFIEGLCAAGHHAPPLPPSPLTGLLLPCLVNLDSESEMGNTLQLLRPPPATPLLLGRVATQKGLNHSSVKHGGQRLPVKMIYLPHVMEILLLSSWDEATLEDDGEPKLGLHNLQTLISPISAEMAAAYSLLE